MEFNLPRPYLSYSQYSLWRSNKEGYRARYYRNEKPFETVETIFGKNAHKVLEESGEVEGSETRIETELVRGLKILGYLDSLIEETLKIRDFKFSHRDKNGKAPWDNIKVRRHSQLVFYTLLVQAKHGRFNPEVELEWLETGFKKEIKEFDGHVLEGTTRELELTGKKEIFTRIIEQWEIDRLKEDIIKVALEISEDFKNYDKIHKSETGETIRGGSEGDSREKERKTAAGAAH